MVQDALIGLTARPPDDSLEEINEQEHKHLQELGEILNALPGVGVGGL